MHYSQDCVNMIGLGLNIHFNELNWTLTGWHKHKSAQTRKHIQWGAGKYKSGNKQDNGNICTDPETTGRAQRQKQAWKTPMNSYWEGRGRGRGNEGQVKHIGTGHTGNTHGLEVKSLRPEQRWVFNNNRKRLWMCDMTWGQTRPQDRGQIWHHAGSPLVQLKFYTVAVSECKTPTQQSPKKENSNTGPFIYVPPGKRNYFHPPCPLSLAISCSFFFILRSYSSHYIL